MVRPPAGASPSGKAVDFDSTIPRFESWRPSQAYPKYATNVRYTGNVRSSRTFGGASRALRNRPPTSPSERLVKNLRRATRKHYSAEEKIRVVLDGLRGESSIAELCRREGIAGELYYSWSKEFLEAGKRRLAGGHLRAVA